MYQKFYLNRKWKYSDDFTGSMLIEPMSNGEDVDIPHSMCITPFNYYDNAISRKVGIYQRIFFADNSWKGKVIFISFEGVAHKALVYINGVNVATHCCGYTGFKVDISSKVVFGDNNLITVKVDSSAELNQPPFVVEDKLAAEYSQEEIRADELSFGGIYRDVILEVKEPIHMEDVFYIPSTTLAPDTKSMSHSKLQSYAIPGRIETFINLSGAAKSVAKAHQLSVRQYINDAEISNQPLSADGKTLTLTGPVKIWDIDSPNVYNIRTDLIYDGMVMDSYIALVGFREAVFRKSGFYLNGRRVKLRGIVRHQTYPYVGLAMPESIQRQDARIIKEELYANAVRTANAPPSKYFLDECDRSGLLVFMDIPGWRYTGDKEWKEQSLCNVRDMITEHRNHPSVILWGTRISGSKALDIDKKANDIAHELDPTRATGGERIDREMPVPEDVYTYGDYSYSQEGDPIETKEDVTSDMDKPYLISGYLGQSYPVKNIDPPERMTGHIERVAGVLDAVIAADDVCGSFANCMCDYVTQAEFAEEDGIAYHGFLDSFRNHKAVTAVMASQNYHSDVLSISTPMRSEKERWEGYGKVYLMTNADRVMAFRNDELIAEYSKEDSPFSNLRHGPIPITDFVGTALEKNGDFSKDQIKRLKRMLNHSAIYGLGAIYSGKGQIFDMIMTRLFYRMSKEELTGLYDEYVSGNNTVRFEAIRGDKVVKSIRIGRGKNMFIRTDMSNANIIERHGYDMVGIRVRITDENSCLLSQYCEHLSVSINGPLQIVGPATIPFRGGMCGVYLRSLGIEGPAEVYLSCPGANTIRVTLSILRAPQADI